MIIYGKNVILRAMEPEDMEMLRDTTNDPSTERLVGGWSFPISKQEQLNWYNSVIGDKRNLRFIVETIDEHNAIGMVNLVDIDWKNRSAFHGIRLAKNAPKGKGYGTDAVMALMRYAFEELQLIRLDGSWVEYNEASIKLYQKCGWSIEGRKKKAKFTNGEYYDVLFGGILSDDYYQVKNEMNWKFYDQK